MLKRIATALWGKFESTEEIKKFGWLAAIFFLIIGTYWGVRPIKDSIFSVVVGGQYLWMAKIVSLFVISPLIVVYGKLVDTYPRQKVFYFLIGSYALMSLAISAAFMHPTIGLANTVSDPTRVIGWAWYVFVESFGSLIVALFWAFTTDTTAPDSARRGFPIIALFGQMGNILGPWVLKAKNFGFAHSGPIVSICAGLMALTGILFYLFIRSTPASQLTGYKSKSAHEEKKETGFLEGLTMILAKPYLMGMFFIIFLYEIIVTVFDYHFKQSVFAAFADEASRAAYLSSYGTWVGIIATLSVLLGINNIQRYLGMTASLIMLPILVASAVGAIYLYPSAITVAFWIMVFSKAVNYALNQPTMKQLYIPTRPDTKYKSQAWIEMFGSRTSKASASALNGLRGPLGLGLFISIVSVASLGLVGIWIMISLYVAKKYNKAIKENDVVC